MFIPRSEGVQEELEFKKSSTWSTTQGLRHVYFLSAGGRVSWLYRGTLWCAFSRKTLWNCYIFVRVCFLIYDVLEYVYHSASDKKFSVQLDSYLVQRKYILRIYVSKLITTQSSSPYKVVLVSTSMNTLSKQTKYGVASVSRIDKITGHFCKRAL